MSKQVLSTNKNMSGVGPSLTESEVWTFLILIMIRNHQIKTTPTAKRTLPYRKKTKQISPNTLSTTAIKDL